jgi:hypothetical protein
VTIAGHATDPGAALHKRGNEISTETWHFPFIIFPFSFIDFHEHLLG